MADIKNHSTLATNLVSYWDLEESSAGTSAVTRYDLHGSNNLTDNNTTASATGKIGNGADIEASNSEYLSIADNASLSITGDLSASMWVKFESYPTDRAVFLSKYVSATPNRSYAFEYIHGSTALRFYNSSNGTWQSSIVSVTWAPSLSTWYHLTFTYDASAGSCAFYVDGSQVGTTQTGLQTSIYDSTAAFQLASSGEGFYFDGVIDEVGVWSKVLTSDEVTDLYNSGDGLPYYDPDDVKNDTGLSTSLTGYWDMEETSGNRADLTGNGLTAVDNGTVGSTASGALNNAADFDGSDDYLAVADNALLDIGSGEFAFSFWIYFDSSLQGWAFERYDYDTNNRSYHLYSYQGTSSNGCRWNISTAGNNDTTVFTKDLTSVISANSWHHFVVTRNSTTTSLYVDGVFQTSGPDSNTYYNATAPLWFGANPTTAINTFLNGKMDEIAFWSGRGLSTAEVRALYGYGTPPVYEAAVGGTSSIKSIAGVAQASIKNIAGVANASIKSIGGVSNV